MQTYAKQHPESKRKKRRSQQHAGREEAAEDTAPKKRDTGTACLTSAYVSIRPHALAYVGDLRKIDPPPKKKKEIRHRVQDDIDAASAYVSIRQNTSAYVSIRQHTSAYVSIRPHACLSRRVRYDIAAALKSLHQTAREAARYIRGWHLSVYASRSQHTSAHVSTHRHQTAREAARYIRGWHLYLAHACTYRVARIYCIPYEPARTSRRARIELREDISVAYVC
jgi:hypothetical protein